MMTVLGFIFVVIGHFALYFDSDQFENPCYNPWSYIIFALAVFIYHILDSSDGK